MQKQLSVASLLALLTIMTCAATVRAQSTSFTYQGRLTDSGNPANGNYDLQFALFDSTSAGTQIGSTLTRSSVAVTGGIFTVQLDFGVSAFPGADRFLEIAVGPAGSVIFTTLSPRQQISSTPYAIRTLSAASADTATNATQLGGVAASQYVQTTDSRLSDARAPTAGSTNYIQNTSSPQASANFNISGNGTTSGTLTGNVVNSATQFNINGNRVLSVAGTNNLFAGPSAGQANTSGASNAFAGAGAGQANTIGSQNAFFGFNAGRNNAGDNFGNGSNNSFFGSSAGAGNTGQQNSFFGSSAGAANTTGNFNSFFGELAGLNNTTGGGNTFVGANAGITPDANNTTGSNNTAIGLGARVDLDLGNNVTNATAIGANAIVHQSNSIVLGSISGLNNATADTNVGIGTSSPSLRLVVVSNDAETALISNNGAQGTGLQTYSQDGIGVSGTANQNLAPPSGKRIGVYGSGADYGVFGASTNGDGVKGTSTVGNAVIGTSTSGAGVVGTSTNAFGVSGTSTNNIGVYGFSGSSYAGYFDGRIHVASVPFSGLSSTPVCVTFGGDIVACSSSLRFKTNVHPFLGGLDLVRRLRPINFNWKEDGRPDIGLGAEDVAKVAPSFAITDKNGEVTGVKYDRLNILLINAVKEQQQQIQKQQQQINQLSREVRRLRGVYRERRNRQ